jgi:hypothetical protein
MTVGTRVTQKKVEKLQQTNYISLEASISTDEELFSELISTVLENVRNMPVELQELQTVLISTQNTINNQFESLDDKSFTKRPKYKTEMELQELTHFFWVLQHSLNI